MWGSSSRRILPTSTPFDVPCDEGFIGVRHDHGTLLAVLALSVPRPGPQRVAEPWRDRGTPGLSWTTLTRWYHRPEAAATELTVMTHGRSTGDDGAAARAYRSLLGPLSIAGERTVHVVVRYAALAHPELVARYGSGRSAALRACLAATHKIAILLREDGLTVSGLTAAELTDMSEYLPPVSSTIGTYTVCPDDPLDLPAALESVWHYSPSACTALIWQPSDDGPRWRAMAGIDGGLDVHLRGDLPPHWRTASGDGGSGRPPRPAGTVTALTGTVIPVAGAGIVVGADNDNRPVTLPLTGPQVPLAGVSGHLDVVQRLVVRLAALGVSSAVFTDRPEQWDHLIGAVRDRRLVHPAADGAAEVLIDDRPDGHLGPLAGHTVIAVRRPDDTDGSHPSVPGFHQDPSDPAAAVVTGCGPPLRVRLVTTPAEDALLGVTG